MKTHSHSCLPRAARLLAAALLSLTASAATLTWSGGNGSWGDPMKWSPQIVPGAADTAVIGGADALIVRVDGSHSVGTVVLSNPKTILLLQGSGQTGQAMLTVANGFVNEGIIELSSETSTYVARLTVTTGTLTNAPGGLIRISEGTGGTRQLFANLDNRGTLDLAHNLTLDGNVANSGTINLPDGKTLTVQTAKIWTHRNGAITGTGTLSLPNNSTLVLAEDFTPGTFVLNAPNLTVSGPARLLGPATGEFLIRNWTINAEIVVTGDLRIDGTVKFNSPLAVSAGKTLRLLGSGNQGQAILTVANGFVNEGIIELSSETSTYVARLTVTTGTLTNAPGGLIRISEGTGGTRQLFANLDNRGALLVRSNATLSVTGSLLNASTGILGGAGTFNLTSATVTNEGTVAPGTSPGILSVSGNLPHGAGSRFEAEIGGFTAGTEHDQLVLANPVNFDGTIRAALINGFFPKKDDAFTVLTYPSRTGSFTTLDNPLPERIAWEVRYGTTSAQLVVLNTAPTLATIGNQTMNEQVQFSVTASATDQDLPAQTLTYSLDTAPTGMTINSATGQITWTPTEAQGPGTHNVTVRVTDNGTPSLGHTTSFSVTVNEVNVAPQLVLPGARTVNEQTELVFIIDGTDADVPPNALTYELVSGPPGATFNAATRELRWTPTEAQGPGSFTATFRVTDSNPDAVNEKQLGATGAVSLTVAEVNLRPTLAGIGNQTATEELLFSVTATATDPDLPANGLAYSLETAPTGMAINPTTGQITWTPTEAQGPGAHNVTVRVTDSGTPALAHTTSFSVTVSEVNRGPTLAGIGNQTANEGAVFSVTATATDPDVPANGLAYSLDTAPTGMTINPATGAITWTPTEAQGPGDHGVTVRVTDNGSPALEHTTGFTVTVKEVNRPPVLASLSGATVHAGTPFAASLAATDPDLPANTFTYSLVSGPGGATVTPAGAVNWNAPIEAAGSVVEFTVRATDDGTPPQAGDETFQVTVAGPVEILGSVAAGDAIEITWRALPGLTYRLISAEALPATEWAPLSGEVTATGSAASKTITINPQSAALFLRVELVTE
jgi:hypothetical protein